MIRQLFLLLLIGIASAQSRVSYGGFDPDEIRAREYESYQLSDDGVVASVTSARIVIQNHGGWALNVSLGANEGDHILFDVKCDHDLKGECLVATPQLNGVDFEIVQDSIDHQVYQINSPNTGDQFVTAQYLWIGAQVHYEINITATELLK